MLLEIPALLSADETVQVRNALLQASWGDGKVTAGYESARVKNNLQLPQDNPTGVEVGNLIVQRLTQNALFMSAALPRRILPPLFNRYEGGQAFGFHIDNAVRKFPSQPERLRTDLSMTLFLTDPDTYDGGELVVKDTYGNKSVKLPAGSAVLYPGTSLHMVTPVTRGMRLASFFWIQSLVREDSQRAMLFDMDVAIQRLVQTHPDHPSIVELTGVYHNLIRRWADV